MKYYKAKIDLLIQAPDEVTANAELNKMLKPSMDITTDSVGVVDYDTPKFTMVTRPEKRKATPYKFLEFLKWK